MITWSINFVKATVHEVMVKNGIGLLTDIRYYSDIYIYIYMSNI